MKTVLLHGLGQTAQDWKDVVCQLSVSNVECPELFSSMGNGISYSRILANLERQYSMHQLVHGTKAVFHDEKRLLITIP